MWPDTLISTLGLIFYATPSFWFGLMAIVVFSIHLQWLPAGGFEDIGTVQTGLWRTIDIARRRQRLRRIDDSPALDDQVVAKRLGVRRSRQAAQQG